MKIEKIINIDMDKIKKISTTKQLYYLLGIVDNFDITRFDCGLVYINKKQNEDILELIINNAKCNKKLYNIKWKILKDTLVDEWIKYSPNVSDILDVPYGEMWLMKGYDYEEKVI